MRTTALFLFIAVALSGPATAATRYVATTGNDGNSGTLAAPLATINRACQLSGPGDTVLVRGGTYLQRVSLGCTGSASARLRFAPYPNEQVVIDGAGGPPDTTLVGIYGNHIDFEGFEVRNATRSGISLWKVQGVRLARNTIHHCELGGIWVGYNQPNGNLDITIEDNIVYNTATRFFPHTTTSGWPVAIGVGNTYGGLIRGNHVSRNHGEGIGVGHSRFVDVIGNTAHDNYSTNLYLDNVQDSLVASNFVHTENDRDFYRHDGPANGISIANEFSDHVFQHSARLAVVNNIVVGARYGLYYGNFQYGSGLHDSLIAHNTVYRTLLEGVRIDNAAHTGTRIEQNIVEQVPGSPIAYAAGGGLTFARNGWWGVTPPASVIGPGDIHADPQFIAIGDRSPKAFRIAASSPMAAAGALLAQVPGDFYDEARTTPTSLGAFEVQPALPRMGIESVAIGHSLSRYKIHNYNATVKIMDVRGLPVANVVVTGTWSGPNEFTASAVTGNNGVAVLPTWTTRSDKTVSFYVDRVQSSGWEHDPGMDKMREATFSPLSQ